MKYDYQPKKFKTFKMPWENTLYMGVELEIDLNRDLGYSCSYHVNMLMKKLNVIHGHFKKIKNNIFYFKYDGSVSNGTEIVSSPFTLQYANKKLNWKSIFENIKENNFFTSSSTGLHVHLNRNFFTNNDIEKLKMFFYTNKEKLFQFSGRENIDNTYCQYQYKNIKDFLSGPKYVEGRYWAVNTNSRHPTIEIRIFKSTLNYKKMKAILQFCDAISHYIKEIGIINSSKEGGWDRFLDWCKYKNGYDLFIKYQDKGDV
jgi:hypothetical protein